MANVSANIVSVEQATITLFGNTFFFPICNISISSQNVALNDSIQLSGGGSLLNGLFHSYCAVHWFVSRNVPPLYYCNIPLNTPQTETKKTNTLTLTRTTDKTFTLTFNQQSDSIDLTDSGRFAVNIFLLKTTDGVYYGYIKPINLQYTDFVVLTPETYFPYMTYKDLTNTGAFSIVMGSSVLPVNNESVTKGSFLSDMIQPLPSDPYSGAGDSTTGGGDGTFDGSSDPVPVPNLPSVGAQDSGFITLFTPTASQMKDLAHYMWVNPLFDIETGFKKLFSDPMDCILGLSVVPVTIPTSGTKNVNIGNLVTSVTMNVASQQYIEVDCGTVTMDRFFGSYLDFEPYTKIAIFLPYCGTHALSMDDIAGKTIGVVYHIDILTGSCIAFVKCGDSVLYEFNGACGSNIPVNSLNFASTIENAIRIAVNIGTTVATAGASAPATTATELARQKAMNTARNISLAGSTAEGALSLKPSVSRSGALGGGVGILGHQIPYFIITRPRLCKPAKQDFFQGYPSFIQTTIGDLIGKGFTSFTNVIISGQYLTDEEETELENILESGVYL